MARLPGPILRLAYTSLTAITLAVPAWAAQGAPAGVRHHVVSYLLSTGPDSTNWTSGLPAHVMPPHPWEWRIFDPRTGRDSLFLKLRSFPVRPRWSPSFEFVEFIYGSRIVRAEWKRGALIREIATLPTDSLWCDFWSDSMEAWHLFTQREVLYPWRGGSVMSRNIGTRWNQDPSGAWHVAVIDSGVGGDYRECYATERLVQGRRSERVTLESLLGSMSLGNHRDSTFQDPPSQSNGAMSRVWVSSEHDSLVGLEMGSGSGDTYHAFEPVVWVDRRHGRRATVYSEGQSRDDTFGQLAFGEWDSFLLIVSEYEGGHPAVVDLRSGAVLFRVDRTSSRAVWVPAPH